MGREFRCLYSFPALILILLSFFLTRCLLCLLFGYPVIFVLLSFLMFGLVSSVGGLVAITGQSPSIDPSQPPLTCIFLPTHKLPFLPSFPKSYKRGHHIGVRFFIGLVFLFPSCLFYFSCLLERLTVRRLILDT